MKVDIVFPRQRVAVFVDGCFWHGCPEHGRVPKANSHYWSKKLNGNIQRDRRTTVALEGDGWRVIRVWEHVPADVAAETVLAALDK